MRQLRNLLVLPVDSTRVMLREPHVLTGLASLLVVASLLLASCTVTIIYSLHTSGMPLAGELCQLE